jgi:hypothetical protein
MLYKYVVQNCAYYIIVIMYQNFNVIVVLKCWHEIEHSWFQTNL